MLEKFKLPNRLSLKLKHIFLCFSIFLSTNQAIANPEIYGGDYVVPGSTWHKGLAAVIRSTTIGNVNRSDLGSAVYLGEGKFASAMHVTGLNYETLNYKDKIKGNTVTYIKDNQELSIRHSGNDITTTINLNESPKMPVVAFVTDGVGDVNTARVNKNDIVALCVSASDVPSNMAPLPYSTTASTEIAIGKQREGVITGFGIAGTPEREKSGIIIQTIGKITYTLIASETRTVNGMFTSENPITYTQGGDSGGGLLDSRTGKAIATISGSGSNGSSYYAPYTQFIHDTNCPQILSYVIPAEQRSFGYVSYSTKRVDDNTTSVTQKYEHMKGDTPDQVEITTAFVANKLDCVTVIPESENTIGTGAQFPEPGLFLGIKETGENRIYPFLTKIDDPRLATKFRIERINDDPYCNDVEVAVVTTNMHANVPDPNNPSISRDISRDRRPGQKVFPTPYLIYMPLLRSK